MNPLCQGEQKESTPLQMDDQSKDRQFKDNDEIRQQNILSLNKRVIIQVSQLGFSTEYVEHIINLHQINLDNEPYEYWVAFIYDKCCEKQNEEELLNAKLFQNDQEYEVQDERSYLEQLLFSMNFNWLGPQQGETNSQNLNHMIVATNNQDNQSQVVLNIERQQKSQIQSLNKGPKLAIHRDETYKILNQLDTDKLQIEAIIQKECCLICLNDIYQSEMFAVAPCGHRFCKECNLSYMGDCIKNANVLRVNCPMQQCKEEYTEEIIQQNVSIEMWTKFKNFKQKKIISLNPNVRWCPKIDCDLYVVGGSLFSKTLQCKCGQDICFDCGNAAHPDLSCENALDDFYRKAKKTYAIHPCPKCKAPIQKSSGCNHMTCYQCNYQFCWICMGQYSRLHYTVFNFCGCIVPGGQFYQTQPWKNVIFWKLLMLIPKLLGAILLLTFLIVLIPVPLIYESFRTPYLVYSKCLNGRRKPWCGRTQEFFICLLLGILFFPISLAIQIFPISCIKLCRYIRYRLS